MENSKSLASVCTTALSSLVLRTKVNATGSIIAATVCSPINDDKIAEMATKPKTIRHVLFPVILIIPKARRLSKP